MKLILTLSVLAFSFSSFSRPEHVITVKDRLRYELWYQGVVAKKKPMMVKRNRLPEELARPLLNF